MPHAKFMQPEIPIFSTTVDFGICHNFWSLEIVDISFQMATNGCAAPTVYLILHFTTLVTFS